MTFSTNETCLIFYPYYTSNFYLIANKNNNNNNNNNSRLQSKHVKAINTKIREVKAGREYF